MQRKPLVAIVDDDEMIGEATKELIETFGLAAQTFNSAQAFLDSDCLRQTSCLVADVQMPGMTGMQLHHKLTTSNHRIPVVFVTAFPDEGTRKRALKAGAICYLTKPFDPKNLRDCIRAAIGHWAGEIDT